MNQVATYLLLPTPLKSATYSTVFLSDTPDIHINNKSRFAFTHKKTQIQSGCSQLQVPQRPSPEQAVFLPKPLHSKKK